MTTVHSGSCLCGTVAFEVTGPFEQFILCHCRRCRKDTGSAHAANLFSRQAQVTWTAGKDCVRTFQLPATRHAKSFCVECGSAVPSLQLEGRLLVVPAGCLDSPVARRPDAHIFCGDRAPWEDGLAQAARFEGLPP